MVIAPNTDIILLKNVPLDNTYTDTIFFNSAIEQYNHFYNTTAYAKKVFGSNTYQRVNSGVMRLEVSADEIYNYNYLMFRNTNYGSKWFYAFITGVEYINNAVAEIRYEIDVMQTYFFDYELEQCYVERETSATDEIGDNLLEESIDPGPAVCDYIISTNHFDSYSVLVFRGTRSGDSGGDNSGSDEGDSGDSGDSGESGPDFTDEYVEGGPGDTGNSDPTISGPN